MEPRLLTSIATAQLPAELVDKLGRPFTVRRAGLEDFDALVAMYVGFQPKRAAQGLPPQEESRIRQWLDRILGQGEHILVLVDGAVAGHAMLLPYNGISELANFLHQDHRDRGIGTALNITLLALAREQGKKKIWLSVEPSNRAAIRSYEKAGFRARPGSLWAPEIEMEIDLLG